MPRDPRLVYIFAALLALVIAVAGDPALALVESKGHQVVGRAGLLGSSYSGPGIANGEFLIPNGLDFELQFFDGNSKAFVARAMLAMDTDTALVRYTYAGVGQRYFLFSKGRADVVSEAGDSLIAAPKWRFYTGWDLGIAQVLVVSYGPVLQTYSTIMEPSACVGASYNITRDISLDVHGAYGMGFGFSSVSVTTTNYRLLFGGALTF